MTTTLPGEFKEAESLFRAFPVVRARLSKVLVRFSRLPRGRQSLPMELLIPLSVLFLPM